MADNVRADAEVIVDIRRLNVGETLHDYEAPLRCKGGFIKHVRRLQRAVGGRAVHPHSLFHPRHH